MDTNAPIIAPVMRLIGVSDIGRSTSFYRDILGFEVREEGGTTEAVCGPARIQFGRHDYGPSHTGEQRPLGSAMLFLNTADVAAMHEYIRARGGAPSEIEKVNWIKMRLFAIRDPDGHTLWFGESYDEPCQPRPSGMMHKTLPQLPVVDVGAAVAHYREVLGFHINHQQDDLGVMDRDEITVLLIPRTEQRPGIGSTYVYVENADALYAELCAKGANVQGEPVSYPWGLRDFAVLDLDGNRLTFGQPFE